MYILPSKNSLHKASLVENEKTLNECLTSTGINLTTSVDFDSIIREQQFEVEDRHLLFFREGYTDIQSSKKVVARKGLKKEKCMLAKECNVSSNVVARRIQELRVLNAD